MKYGMYQKSLLLGLLGLSQLAFAEEVQTPQQPHTAVMTAAKQTEMSPKQVLQRLKDGNQRFMSGKMKTVTYSFKPNHQLLRNILWRLY